MKNQNGRRGTQITGFRFRSPPPSSLVSDVLMEYGWEPNSGLGTMLKYRDRVVHDRKNESEGSEWRSKIGKMLMDGYSGGTLVVTNIPKKVHEFAEVQCPEIKLEF